MNKNLKISSLIFTVALSFGISGCGGSGDDDNANDNKLTFIESVGGFSVPESVVGKDGTFYVSNVNSKASGNHWIDNNGFISKVTKEEIGGDSIVDLKWIEDLQAPKGMALTDTALFVADVATVVLINLSNSEKIVFDAPNGTEQLNDIALDKANSKLYVTDYGTSQILRLIYNPINPIWEIFYDTEDNNPAQNGLYLDNGKLIMQGEKGKLKSINLEDNAVTLIAENLCGDNNFAIDGITKSNEGDYIVSDWNGAICVVKPTGESTVLEGIQDGNTADIFFVEDDEGDEDLLLVPDFDSQIDIYM